jgi:hypothetical protein
MLRGMTDRLFALVLVAAVPACANKSGTQEPPAPDTAAPTPASDDGTEPAPCMKTGCSGTVCADEDRVSTCEYKPEYACYRDAVCERQAEGECGWTQTPELEACLADPPAE